MSVKQPNILILITDQQPASAMSCTGNSHLKTPAMDSLAAAGTRFERAYCTNPVCLPSRFSLMTGRFPSELTIRHNDLTGTLPVTGQMRDTSLGPMLRQAGYETVYGGKTHVPAGIQPRKAGFRMLTNNSREELATVSADWIRKEHDRPWCMVASFVNPHDICYLAIRDSCGREDERRLVDNGKTELACLDEALTPPAGVSDEEFLRDHCPPLPANYEPQLDEPEAIDWLVHERPFKQYARERWTDNDWRRHRYALYRLTERVDGHLQEVLTALRESGQGEETVVIFTSDHGDMAGSHRMEHKTALYEEAARVPLIISQPGTTAAGAVETRLASNGLDLLPTVCDYAGIESPRDLLGVSLRPLAEGEPVDSWRDHVAIESQIGRGVIMDDAKYVRYDFGRAAEQLYHRDTNPDEMRNSRHDPGLEPCLARCRERFEQHFEPVCV